MSEFADPRVREQVSPDEWSLRVALAACYRLVALHGWSDLVFTHISARVAGPDHHFLINPYGLMFDEITASSLVKVDEHCHKVIDSPHPVNPAGFVIHSAVHAARPDVVCVLHTHTRAGVAVSAQRDGLLPISQQASLVVGSLAYHDYEGLAVREDEKARLQADLGDCTHLILRNHGLLTVGASVPDAFLAMYLLEVSCQIQVMAMAGGGPLTRVDPAVIQGATAAAKVATRGQGSALVWPALLRRLDRELPGYAA